jgi:hypothetical protein
MNKISLLFVFFVFSTSSHLIYSQNFELDTIESLPIVEVTSRDYGLFPICTLDTCFYDILDIVVNYDESRSYFRSKQTIYKFIFQDQDSIMVIFVQPEYLNGWITPNLIGVINYKNRIILCKGDQNDLLRETKDSIKIIYQTDYNERYWGSDTDGELIVVCCSNHDYYFYLYDILNQFDRSKNQKRKSKKIN